MAPVESSRRVDAEPWLANRVGHRAHAGERKDRVPGVRVAAIDVFRGEVGEALPSRRASSPLPTSPPR